MSPPSLASQQLALTIEAQSAHADAPVTGNVRHPARRRSAHRTHCRLRAARDHASEYYGGRAPAFCESVSFVT
jgi:hypothetical protein